MKWNGMNNKWAIEWMDTSNHRSKPTGAAEESTKIICKLNKFQQLYK